jgi:hypothetical protein
MILLNNYINYLLKYLITRMFQLCLQMVLKYSYLNNITRVLIYLTFPRSMSLLTLITYGIANKPQEQ